MITEFILDNEFGKAGTPVEFVEFQPGDMVEVRLLDGRYVQVEAGIVSAHVSEETLSALAEQAGIREDTLLKAAQQGRLLARRSGATWLSTVTAIEAAVKSGRIRK